MKTMNTVPLVSVGDIKFGMKREEIRHILGEFKEFRKTEFSTNSTDDFGFCHVYYDKNDCCEAVEVFDAEIIVDGKIVYPNSIDTLKACFPNAKEYYGGYVDKLLSIGFYAPDDIVESILFGVEGYYS